MFEWWMVSMLVGFAAVVIGSAHLAWKFFPSGRWAELIRTVIVGGALVGALVACMAISSYITGR